MILIALGANLPGPDGSSPLSTCRRAAMALDMLPGLRLRGLSCWYQTAPVPPSDQPPYINGVAHLCGSADPVLLLAALQAMEARAGRVREQPHAARPLDLDIIAVNLLVRTAPDPVLPHPRAHERAFVLAPLRDVAPDWVHPSLGESVAVMLSRLAEQDVRPIR
jgi:2-amino-4-hydroxy-6-hydroxymethyldihydropteridine diphosphokinase